MSKSTPGPWKLDRRSENLVGANGANVVVYASGLSFAGLPTEEFRANARLIAAAPDMLGALHGAKALLQFGGIDPDNAILASVLAAIAKATGGAE